MARLLDWLVGQVWPNLVASLIWALPAFVWQHRRLDRRIAAHHEQTRAQIAAALSATRSDGGTP